MHIKWILFFVILTFSCKKEKKEIDYSLYSKMDKVIIVKKNFRPRKKATVPFSYNQIYDPFITKSKGRNSKALYEKGLWTNIKLSVLDSVITNIDITSRKEKRKRKVRGFPVIIENTSEDRTMSIPLHRGCAKIVQEALNSDNEWIEIEQFTKEKLGDFYYQIPPYQYIYTKIPIYEGRDTTSFRLSLLLDDSIFYSNTYESTIQKWMLRK